MSKEVINVLSFYKFIKLQSLEILRKEIYRFMSQRYIYGTIILSPEGVNINICGNRDKIEESKKFLLRRLKIHKVFFNVDNVSEVAFTKLKVKIKKEIIKLGFHLQQNEILDHEHVDSGIRQSFEELGGHSGMGAHSDSHNGNLGNVGTLSKLAASTFLQVLPESFFSPKRIFRRNRKSQVGLSIASYVLNDHIDFNIFHADRGQNFSSDTRNIGYAQ